MLQPLQSEPSINGGRKAAARADRSRSAKPPRSGRLDRRARYRTLSAMIDRLTTNTVDSALSSAIGAQMVVIYAFTAQGPENSGPLSERMKPRMPCRMKRSAKPVDHIDGLEPGSPVTPCGQECYGLAAFGWAGCHPQLLLLGRRCEPSAGLTSPLGSPFVQRVLRILPFGTDPFAGPRVWHLDHTSLADDWRSLRASHPRPVTRPQLRLPSPTNPDLFPLLAGRL